MTYVQRAKNMQGQEAAVAQVATRPRAIVVESPGQVRAVFNISANDAVPPRIAVSFDKIAWAVLPASRHGDEWEIVCSIPPHLAERQIEVVMSDAVSGNILARDVIQTGSTACNRHGLPARDVLDLTAHPMYSVPWVEFDGACLTVAGAHLPPLGDPDLLSVEFAEGVVGSFEYPLASPEFGAHYWYWPNAAFSNFRVRINLAASSATADAFSFRFVVRMPPDSDDAPAPWADRGRIWVPASLRDFMGFPVNENQLSRVQTWSSERTVAFTGYNAFKTFESLLARHGVTPRPGLKLLDWGCGHGRVARHFIAHWPKAEICGADIDAENIAWCQANLPGGDFQVAGLWPPMAFEDASCDVVIGLSVMTHLTEDAQISWINEVRRILKPGGIALITFGGHGAAAYASLFQTPQGWARWLETGFDDGQVDPALEGKISDSTYYRVTHQTPRHARALWSRSLTLVDIEPQVFGYQDVAILRAAR
jgi:SAM-dependent methyltransferase